MVAAFACRQPGEVNAGAAGTTETSTTSTSGTDTSGTTTTSTAASATTTGSTGGTVSNMSAEDKEFVIKAAQGGMSEVALGKMAVSKAASADVKTFGSRMVTDHSKANDELKQIAIIKGLDVPAVVGREDQKTADELSKTYGTDFDKAYMRDMVEDHEKDVKEFEKASKNAKDADIRNWATKILPTLQEHLRMAKDTQMKVK
jgi:putative membrane protein